MLLEGKKVYVGPFLKRSDRPADKDMRFTNVFAKNLPESVDDNKLNEMFSAYGEVTSAIVMKVRLLHANLHIACCIAPEGPVCPIQSPAARESLKPSAHACLTMKRDNRQFVQPSCHVQLHQRSGLCLGKLDVQRTLASAPFPYLSFCTSF